MHCGAPAGRVEKVSIGLIAKEKKIVVTVLVKDYKELVTMMEKECSKRDSIEVDPRVNQLLENWI